MTGSKRTHTMLCDNIDHLPRKTGASQLGAIQRQVAINQVMGVDHLGFMVSMCYLLE